MISRDELINIRDNAPQFLVPRSLRKALFRCNIWCPSPSSSINTTPSSSINTTKQESKHLSSAGIRGGLINARSINDKEHSLYQLICDHKLDFLAITQTWCNANSSVSLGQITPPGYSIIHTERPSRGGGIALTFSDSFKFKHIRDTKHTTLEHQTVSLSSKTSTVFITTVYKPQWNIFAWF